MRSKTCSSTGLFIAAVIAAALAGLLFCTPCAWAKTGSVNAVIVTGTIASGSTTSQKVTSSAYAIVKSDGYLHATNRAGTADYGYLWGADYSSFKSALDAVTTLYIDSNVTSLKTVKAQYKSGSSSINKTITLNGNTGYPGTHNVKSITFVRNSSGKNSCSAMDDWYQFSNLQSLETVYNFNYTQMTSVPNGCFYKCSNLCIVCIPNQAVSIGSSAFYDCDRLSSVFIPASVTSIGAGPTNGVFANCDKLAKVVLYSTSRVNITSNSFLNTPASLKIYVPNSVVTRYQEQVNSNPWKSAKLTSQIHPFLEVADLPDATYTGSAIKPAVTVTYLGETLSNDNYTVSYANNVKVGTAKVTVTGKSTYPGSVVKTFNIVGKSNNASGKSSAASGKANAGKAASTREGAAKSGQKTIRHLNAKGKSVSVKAGKSAKAAKAVKLTGAQGKVTYAKVSGKSKIKVKPNGKITVKKGCKRATHAIKVCVMDAGGSSRGAESVIVTIRVKVK